VYLNILCYCGRDYKAEAELYDGRMAVSVHCPYCGADGTDLADALLAGSAESQREIAPAAIQGTPPAQQMFAMGVLGALLAGCLCMALWYGLRGASNRWFYMVALLVGAATGMSARALARVGSQSLGIVAAICACGAILSGELLSINHRIDKMMDDPSQVAEMVELGYARKLMAAKPGDEFMQCKRELDEALPKIQAFKDGTMTSKEFEDEVWKRNGAGSLRSDLFWGQLGLLFVSFWLIVGAVAAYKTAAV
jgi:hypothetical protein